MAATKRKQASRKGRPRKRRTTNAGLFDAPAVKRARKVVATPRVKDKETGQLGTVIGVNGEWLKVKWDNRTKATLAKPSMLRTVNGKGSRGLGVGSRVKKNTTIIRAKRVRIRIVNRKRRHRSPNAPEPKWLQKMTDGQLRKWRKDEPGDCTRWIPPVLAKRKAKKNPAPGSSNPRGAAKRKFEEFQGRGATKVTSENVSSLAGKRKLYAIGPLKELKIKGVGVRQGARGSKLLADTKGKLWISEKIGTARPGSTGLVKIGEVEHVVYHARKPHVEADKWQDFIHQLGEETGKLPTLFIDPQGFGVLKGGAYTIESRGIVN